MPRCSKRPAAKEKTAMTETPSLFDDIPQQEMPSSEVRRLHPVDQAERESAIDVTRSVLVQAPAGSGKTDLLTRRFLALLADGNVEGPEQILAITFTRAATAEMRARILKDLRDAASTNEQTGEDERRKLARRALAKARERGWPLLEQPALLQVETIDSLCMRIAHGQPLLARLGGQLSPVDDAGALYLEAARRTIRHLGSDNQELSSAIQHLLSLRDTHLGDCEQLIADMLRQRNGWQEHFPLAGDVDWEVVRFYLEQPFRDEVQRALRQARELISVADGGWLASELMAVVQYALSHRADGVLGALASLGELSASSSPGHWKSLCAFLLTGEGEWRRSFTVKDGIPPASKDPKAKQWKARLEKLMDSCRRTPGLLAALQQIQTLPGVRYEEAQWETLRHLFVALRHALAELRVVFAEYNQVDFLQISRAALDVLRQSESGMRWSEQLRHILVDEFQDTSRQQHQLLEALVEHWMPEDGRTFFLVGDPMQSIYLFRQAEVELFERVRERGLSDGLTAETLKLRVNFRSHARLTEPLNEVFEPVFAAASGAAGAGVEFEASSAAVEEVATIFEPPLQVHAQLRSADADAEQKRALRLREAETVAGIIEQHAERIAAAQEAGEEYRIAVLVRNRSHLAWIVPALRQRGIAFRAVEIESLAARQEMLDLMALVRALVHPMDRIAWLSLLRAPWCGLSLEDLHGLAGRDDAESSRCPMLELMKRNLSQLGEEAQARVRRVLTVMERAAAARKRPGETASFSAWVERTWHALGGPLCLEGAERENAEVFFSLLDEVSPDGSELLTREFSEKLERLFAQPDPAVSERCGVQIMTMHKAKGLGFDVVIVPGLERGSGKEKQPLVTSLQRPNQETGKDDFFVAPIGAKGSGTKDPLYAWVQKQRRLRYSEERKRLFYVACTRSRQELHLIGTAAYGEKGLRKPTAGSLLATAWPALEGAFEMVMPRAETVRMGEVLEFPAARPVPGVMEEIAAAVASGTRVRRLPLSAEWTREEHEDAWADARTSQPPGRETRFRRPEGSRLARAVGHVLHTMLERMGAEIAAGRWDAAGMEAKILRPLRDHALHQEQVQEAAREVLRMLEQCAADEGARWILGEHEGAASEPSWTGRGPDGVLRTLRADRVFQAGARPMEAGDGYLWIVDYKTSVPMGGESAEEFFMRERSVYAPQLQAYAQVLRAARGTNLPVRLALYYPRLEDGNRLDWWGE
jgi:ATP-dependent exoDNAse (exonuclease V) beta subunit